MKYQFCTHHDIPAIISCEKFGSSFLLKYLSEQSYVFQFGFLGGNDMGSGGRGWSIPLRIFWLPFKLDGIFVVLCFSHWSSDHYMLSHTLQKHICHVMCKILWQVPYWNLDESKLKFPANLNCDGELLVGRPRSICTLSRMCLHRLMGLGNLICVNRPHRYQHCHTCEWEMSCSLCKIPPNLMYKPHQIPKLICLSSHLLVVFAQSIEDRC